MPTLPIPPSSKIPSGNFSHHSTPITEQLVLDTTPYPPLTGNNILEPQYEIPKVSTVNANFRLQTGTVVNINETNMTPIFTSPITTPMAMKQMGPPQCNAKPIIAIPDLSMILESLDNDFDNQYAENWLKMQVEQTAYHRFREIPFCDDILDEALFDTQQGRYYMRELGLWDSAFKNILIHHKLMSTTFTYSKDTMSYEFINISDYLDSYVLIFRDPLIRAHMGNAGNIQSPPPTGYSPRFAPKVLPLLHWSKRYLPAIKAQNVPFGPENTTPDFVPTYHHVPDMV